MEGSILKSNNTKSNINCIYIAEESRNNIMKKTVVITGATDGIGKALAELLAGEYQLVLFGRSEEKMNALLEVVGDSCVSYEAC